jgi:phosphoribosylformylglycinamidine (FGAM) synthase PurS component
MNFIEIFYKDEKFDVVSKARLEDISTAGYDANFSFKTEHIYKIEGNLNEQELLKIAEDLLVDPIIQNAQVNTTNSAERYSGFYIVDIWLKKGVTDTVGETIENSIKTLGISAETRVNTGFRYLIDRKLDEKYVAEIVQKLLMNSVIQEFRKI